MARNISSLLSSLKGLPREKQEAIIVEASRFELDLDRIRFNRLARPRAQMGRRGEIKVTIRRGQ